MLVGSALGLETLALGIATIIAAVTHPHPGRLPAYAMIVCMAMGMGLRNATVRHIGVPDMTTTVLTMTLTGLAADAAIVGGPGKGSARRLSAIVAMLVGAICGALMLRIDIVLPMAFCTGLALVACVAYRATQRGAS